MDKQVVSGPANGDSRASTRLIEWVQASAERVCGASLERIEVRPFQAATSYDCYEVTVHSDDQPPLDLFLKDFRFTKLIKDQALERSIREVSTYEQLLSSRALGTPEYIASHLDEDSGRHWLLIEFVKGQLLSDLELDHWIDALPWLARMHASFALQPGDLESAHYLLDRGSVYNEALAADALANGTAALPQASREIQRLVECFRLLIPEMAALPRTLVHGAFRARQILVDESAGSTRIAPVDWEVASYASGLLDVAYFTNGFQAPVLDRMLDVYVQELSSRGVHVNTSALPVQIDMFRLERVMRWLAISSLKGFTPEQVDGVVRHGEEILDSLQM